MLRQVLGSAAAIYQVQDMEPLVRVLSFSMLSKPFDERRLFRQIENVFSLTMVIEYKIEAIEPHMA